jgi:ABC-2 type transport system permease protein
MVLLAAPTIALAAGAVAVSGRIDAVLSGRFAIFVAVSLTYLVFWLGLALAINTVGKSSSWNATVLIALWIVLVLVVPAAANVTAATWYPGPPRTELIAAMRQAWIETDQLEGQTAIRYYEDHPELLPASVPADVRRYAATTFYADQLEIDRRIDPVFARFEERVDLQQAVVHKFSFLSPAIAAHTLFTDAAGTGHSRFKDFRIQVEEFHSRWREFFVPRLFRLEKIRSTDLDSFPKFNYREEHSASVVMRSTPHLMGIAIPTLVLLALSMRAARRFNRAT